MGFVSAASTLKDIDETVRAAAQRALMNASDDIQSTGRDTVREWTNQVDFEEVQDFEEKWLQIDIKPTGAKQIFQWVDKGTKPHLIAPKTAGGRLFFRSGYSARTAPINKYNQGSGESFGALVTANSVNHPGTKPRKFLETDLDELIPTLQIRVTTEIQNRLT